MKRATIKAGRWRYRLTERDILWAARMVQGETRNRAGRAEDALAVLWTMTQLFSPRGQQSKYGRQRFGTYADLIRAYSQPINPHWLADGSFCRPGGRAARSDACSPERTRRRTRLQRTPWNELHPGLRAVVLAWARGQTTNPVPKAVEFAAEAIAAAFIDSNPGAVRIKRAHNTFIATADSRRWTALPRVEMTAAVREGFPTGVVAVALGLGGVLAWVARRKSATTRGLRR